VRTFFFFSSSFALTPEKSAAVVLNGGEMSVRGHATFLKRQRETPDTATNERNMDWSNEIAKLAYEKQQLAAADKKRLLPHHLPNLAVTDEMMAEADNRIASANPVITALAISDRKNAETSPTFVPHHLTATTATQ